MKIHPEMKEVVEREMQEGLRHWRNKSPEEILKRVRENAIREQQTIMNPTKGIAWKKVYKGCDCAGVFGHYPWCNGHTGIELFTPEPEKKPRHIDGRDWYFGSSGYMPFMPFDDSEGKQP